MSKATKPSSSDAAADDAVSLHTNPGPSDQGDQLYRDDDDFDQDAPLLHDLPPTYNDALHGEPSDSLVTPATLHGQPPQVVLDPFAKDHERGALFFVDRRLEDPERLEAHIKLHAATPPRPYIRLLGTHKQTTRDSKGKTETNTITDFDVSVEMTPYLFSDARARKSWAQLRTADNSEKVPRGTILAKRAPGSKQSIEVGGDPKPTLQEWCHRFGASPAGLKCFTLRRRMVGFDFDGVNHRLAKLVNDLGYRGHLQVQLVVKDDTVDCYNEAKPNFWRLTPWIRNLFFFTLLFLFAWPYLWLRTKRWEVVVAEWPYSRMAESGNKEYVTVSEDQWYNLWARSIAKAVLEKRQKVLDQADLRDAEGAEPTFSSGNTVVDGAVGFFRAGVSAMNEVNRQLGWGGDC
jgi:hypothetical protein